VIEILNPAQVETTRRAGQVVAETLAAVSDRARPGTNLLEIDAWTREMIDAVGAVSCYVDYAPSFGRGPFGKVICTSVNDAVLHGLPHDATLEAGDLLSLDLAVSVDGWVADAAVSVVVGAEPTAEDARLIGATRDALAAGIDQARPGRRTGDVSAAVGQVLRAAGFPVNTEFGGHGVGRTMHQDPHIPNDGRPGRGVPLRPGMAIAIEPWVMADTDRLTVDADGWTLRSATGCRTAHTEHTVVVTDGEPLVVTRA
jgi:methionyl aminopeptidase